MFIILPQKETGRRLGSGAWQGEGFVRLGMNCPDCNCLGGVLTPRGVSTAFLKPPVLAGGPGPLDLSMVPKSLEEVRNF